MPDAGADGQAAAEPLRERDDVGDDPLALVREPGAGPSHPALHLVEHQQRPGGVAGRAGVAQVALGRRDHAPLPLGRLEEDGGAVGPHRGAQGRGVAVGHEPDVDAERRERLPDRGLAGQAEGAHGPAVERMLSRDEDRPGAALAAPDQLDRGLVGLRAGVGEEHPAVHAQQADDPLGQPDLRLVQVEVGRVHQAPGLLGHGRHDPGVRVAQRADRHPGDQVQVGAAVHVPHHAPAAVRQRHRRQAVGQHDRGGIPVLQFFRRAHAVPPGRVE